MVKATHATFSAISAVAVAAVQDEHLEQGTLEALVVQAAQSKLVTSPAGHCEVYGRSHASGPGNLSESVCARFKGALQIHVRSCARC